MLTDTALRNLKPKSKTYKASDRDGMYVTVSTVGMTYERVLIVPTGPIAKFIATGVHLEANSASSFYVAVTRARQSVAIVMDRPGKSTLPYWSPAPPSQSNPRTIRWSLVYRRIVPA